MKQHKFLCRIISLAICLILLCGLSVSAHAADTLPLEYWKPNLNTVWSEALESNDPDKIIAAAEQTYDLLIRYEKNTAICGNLEFKCGYAAMACEAKGDLNGAIKWLERHLDIVQWLKNNGQDFSAAILGTQSHLAILRDAANPVIYTLSEDAESPYSVGPKLGTWCGSVVEGNHTNESAVLFYIPFLDGYSVEYWLNSYKSQWPVFNNAATQGGVIELAWNFSPENTDSVRKVLDGSSDAYISEGLKAISQLNATVLLRIGAEMNVWTAGCDPDVFKAAFRKIADEAHKYSNIKTVFSPGDVGGLDSPIAGFWPGDEYVDWVGMSTYHCNGSYASYGFTAEDTSGYERYKSYNTLNQDAFYSRGVYSGNPMSSPKEVMDLAAAHNKPVMISECGFGYGNKNTGADQTAFAASQLTTFYAYVNMVYPQVKAVFYFNHNGNDTPWLYLLEENATVKSAYDAAIKNGSYLAWGESSAGNWVTLDKANVKSADGKLKLATYAMIPGSKNATTTVSYYVDEKWTASRSTAPYIFELDVSSLSAGTHTIRANAALTDGSRSCVVSTTTYTIEVPGAGAKPEEPAAAIAYPSTQTVNVDGKAVEFQMYALKDANGYPTNYVKIRELAVALNGTAAQFDVGWNGVVNLIAKTPYTGSTDAVPSFAGQNWPYSLPDKPTNVNGSASDLVGIVLTDSAGGGHTYYQLRDLGKKLGFNVDWSPEKGVFIETDKPYANPN